MRSETRKALRDMDDTRGVDELLQDAREDVFQLRITMMKAEALRLLAVQVRDAALAREREAFDARWSFFFKCRDCGGRVEPEIVPPPPCQCGSRVIVTAGYARPA